MSQGTVEAKTKKKSFLTVTRFFVGQRGVRRAASVAITHGTCYFTGDVIIVISPIYMHWGDLSKLKGGDKNTLRHE